MYLGKHYFKQGIIAALSVVFLFGIASFAPDVAFAQGDFGLEAVEDAGIGLSNQPLDVTIMKLIRILLGFLGLVAVVIVLYGGYMYMTAAGNEDRVSRAKMILRNGLIGLAIILFSFIIVQFVIRTLSDAAGPAGRTPLYDPPCPTASSCHIPMCGDKFGAVSVTPKQPQTGMNNIVIRAVFTKPVATPAADVLTIEENNANISNEFTYRFVPGTNKQVVEAVYTLTQATTEHCDTTNGYLENSECLVVPGDFTIVVNDDVVATDGSGIEFGEKICSDDSGLVERVEFQTDVMRNDTVAPQIQNMGLINPDTGSLFSADNPTIPSGREYIFSATIDDASIEGYGGVSYVTFELTAPGEPDLVVHSGPSTNAASSQDAYTFTETLSLSSRITTQAGEPKQYALRLTAWDIDHNSVTKTSGFVLKGHHCFNNQQDGDETGVDIGGSCGKGGGTCDLDAQCASGKCIENQCVPFPKITDVKQMDGAPGNWVTIFGEYFGQAVGTIEFGSEDLGWQQANLVQCEGVLDDTWHESYAIVEVPQPIAQLGDVDGGLALDSGSYIELVPPGEGGPENGWAVGVWVQLDSTTASENQGVISVGTDQVSLDLVFTPEKTVRLVQRENEQIVQELTGGATDIFDDSNWVFVSLAEHEVGWKKVYLNGENYLFSNEFPVLDLNDSNGGPSIRLGQSSVGESIQGAVFDEFVVVPSYPQAGLLYSRILPAFTSQSSSDYENAIRSFSPVPPIWYWRLGDSNSEQLREIISNEFSGRVEGEATMRANGIFGSAVNEIVSEVVIRITTEDGNYSDTTIDEFGPKPGNNNGLFTYNDIERPGLCAVVVDGDQDDVSNGDIVGPPGVRIRAHGTGFADTQVSGDQIIFDVQNNDIPGNVFDWTESRIRTEVPINFAPGNPLIRVKKDQQESNEIPFTVTSADLSDLKPLITDIDPEDPTPGSFLTIYGNNFGVAGAVYISKQKNPSCSFNDPNDGCTELSLPPLPCKNTWTNTQIIVEIDESYDDFGDYYVVVERADNHLQSDGATDIVSIQDGPPKPSICELTPVQGPAPLPPAHDGLRFRGKNFTQNPVLYFWNGSGDNTDQNVVNDLNSNAWLAWDGSDPDETRWNVNTDGTQIISSIAYQEASAYPTMPFGQWPISITANNVKGNSVQYFVSDCRTQDQPADTDLQCCTEGKDAGSWKYICDGEVRDAGYVWRFTTGILADVPYVLTQCDEDQWFGGEYMDPSPVPSTEWEESENMCLNATVQVALSMGLDESTITPSTVLVYECGSATGEIDCDYGTEDLLTDLDLDYQSGEEPVLIIKQGDLSGEANFSPNTWHRVILTTDILSVQQDIGSGVTDSRSLRIDRPLSEFGDSPTVAFYYDFQTGDTFCTLNSADIVPRTKTVSHVGLLMDTWYQNLPFYYYLRGRADRKCTVVNVDALGWQWSSNKPDRAEIAVAPSSKYTDTRATAEAKKHTPEGVEFSATADTTGSVLEGVFPDNIIEANTSTLFITLGKPQVVYYEPNCADACPNGIILARFNRHMDPTTYAGGITIYECGDPNCINLDKFTSYTVDDSSMLEVKILPTATTPFVSGAYYKVVLDDTIKSLGTLPPNAAQDGESLEPHEWVFRTKEDGTLCAVDHVRVTPHPFVATYIGQKQKFTATPYGAPSECSATGQPLSLWEYEYQWESTDTQVAEVTTFSKTQTTKNYCSPACVPLGSDVVFAKKDTPLCGNSVVDPGEDCDIAIAGEVIGQTCTLECLRPGSSATYCGNGVNDTNQGEQCDPAIKAIATDGSEILYCTDACTLQGSSDIFNPTVTGFCGDGQVGFEEACDIGLDPDDTDDITRSRIGCSTSCLHIGTQLAAEWCESSAATPNGYVTQAEIATACRTSQSVCGNGVLELGEQCELTGSNAVSDLYCSPACLYYDGNPADNEEEHGQIGICGTSYEQCEAGTEGCTNYCTYAGSSLFYSTPSLCGDGADGIGEEKTKSGELICEIPSAQTQGNATQAPLQIATAIGDGVVVSGTQKTDIDVVMPLESKNGSAIEGTASYTLQCGFTEYDELQENGFSNDCTFAAEDSLDRNGLGVGYNSCCSLRPIRTSEYPVDGAGLGNEEPVCRNTYIEVSFSTTTPPIDPGSIAGNAQLARGYETVQNCSSLGGEDVTDIVNKALGFATGVVDAQHNGFWSTLWNGVKNLIKRFFGGDAFAQDVLLKNIQTWCTTDVVLTTDVSDPTHTLPLYISNLLGDDSVHTAYAVILKGGKNGIKDVKGVGIKHQTKAMTSDVWVFEVGTKVCKIDDVQVDPPSYLFSEPNTSTDVGADARTASGQLIVPTSAYGWVWSWQPQLSSIFDIPVNGFPADSQFTKLGSTNVEGTLTAVAQTIITKDRSTENNHLGKIFEGTTQLTSAFCENPWPERSGGEWSPYADELYQFSFSYCADAGQSGNTADDLPFLVETPVETFGDGLNKTLFVSDVNTDGIGIQIFENPNRLTAAEWFAERFPTAAVPQQITLAGYDAVADQDNYYVNALNIVRDEQDAITAVYNNIYLFSISQGSQESTRDVFQQILDSLEFNTNLTDHGYCIGYDNETPDFVNACTTDFDCILGPSDVVLQEGTLGVCTTTEDGAPQTQCATDADCTAPNTCVGAVETITTTYTSLGCHAEKSKLLRDWERLQDVKTIQVALENAVPALEEGTFRKNYVSSVWPSWGSFGNTVGQNLPLDPINVWDGCDPADPQTCWDASTTSFICPQHASVYEYEYNKDTESYSLHVPMEFFINEIFTESAFSALWIDPNENTPHIVDSLAFTTERGCVPGQAYSVVASQCGDGVVGPGEQCDPPGKQGISFSHCSEVGAYQEWVCTDSCTIDIQSECKTGGQCGNGIVEAGEACDDGALNGTYGHCSAKETYADAVDSGITCSTNVDCEDGNQCTLDRCINNVCRNSIEIESLCPSACQGLHAQYCGNGHVDTDTNGNVLELCDWGTSGIDLYSVEQQNSCSWDCQSYGEYCGDGIVQTDEGEACDDGNTQNGDGCSASCQEEGVCAYPGAEVSCLVSEGCAAVQIEGKKIIPPAPSSLCVFEEDNIVYTKDTSENTDFVEVFSCESDDVCRQKNTYGVDGDTIYTDTSPYESFNLNIFNTLPLDRFTCASFTSLPTIETSVSCTVPLPEENESSISENGGVASSGPACGNGVVDAGEQCDPNAPGTKTIAACSNLGYSESCTYCTDQCVVETIESSAFCGNGVIDAGEQCEAVGDGIVAIPGDNSYSCDALGFEYGTVSCNQSCTEKPQVNCFSCGLAGIGALPRVSVINPMVASINSNGTDSRLYMNLFVDGKGESGITKLGSRSFDSNADLQGVMENINVTNGDTITAKNQCNAICDESNGTCENGYFMTFANGIESDDAYQFQYPVIEDIALAHTEYVLSPVVQEETIRVVIRWTRDEEQQGANMRGYLKSHAFSTSLTGYGSALGDLCDEAKGEEFADGSFGIIPMNCEPLENGVYVHPETGVQNTFVQATTIDLNAFAATNTTTAFLVGQEGGGNIPTWENANISVDVYTYREGQSVSQYYPPTYQFHISDAQGTSSNPDALFWHVFNILPSSAILQNEAAFAKTVPGSDMVLIPVASIETNDCWVQENMYTNFVGAAECVDDE